MGKRKKFKTGRKYLFDGLLIVFSVLFALFLNNLTENIKRNKEKRIAEENIRKEIDRNFLILETWMDNHDFILEQISGILEGENDSLRNRLMSYNYFNVGVITEGKSLIETTLTKTAWETVRTTGIISEFDFETTQKLTEIYMLQGVIMENTMMKIVDFLFDPATHNMEQLDPSLMQLQLRFRELTGQERLLLESYKGMRSFSR